MSNEITTTNDTKVTEKLCIDYLAAQNTNLTDGERKQYLAVAMALNLNPFLREIYPIKFNGKMTLVTGYQVYIRRAEEFPQYDGFDTNFEGEGRTLCCICNVYRKDRNRPTSAKVYLSEYSQGNSMWNSKPHVMLEKVAIGTAFRRAFPKEFNGMPYASEEVRAEDDLKAQGYTEVRNEPAAPAPKAAKPEATEEDRKSVNFKKAMKKLEEIAPGDYKLLLLAHGYKTEGEVEPENRHKVHDGIKAELDKMIAEKAAKNTETAEAEEAETINEEEA